MLLILSVKYIDIKQLCYIYFCVDLSTIQKDISQPMYIIPAFPIYIYI